jgi:hypothetical protein
MKNYGERMREYWDRTLTRKSPVARKVVVKIEFNLDHIIKFFIGNANSHICWKFAMIMKQN